MRTKKSRPVRTGIFLNRYIRSKTAGSEVLGFFLDLQNLLAAIHAGFKVDMVRATQFARILVFDIGRGSECVSGATHATLGRGSFAFWNGHWKLRVGRLDAERPRQYEF